MRISTNGLQLQAVTNMMTSQTKLAQTQQQLATGKKILTPSDDPVGSVQMLALEQKIAELDQYDRNASLGASRLAIAESNLTEVTNLLQRARELLVQGNNDSQTVETRRYIGEEIQANLDAIMQLANAQDGTGDYLFAGFQSDTTPFSESGSIVQYYGDDGQRQTQVSANAYVATDLPGSEVFLRIRNGNGTLQASAEPNNTGSGNVAAYNLTDPAIWNQQSFEIRFTSSSNYDLFDGNGTNIGSGTFTAEGDTITVPGAQLNIEGTPATGDVFTLAPSQHQSVFQTLSDVANALVNVETSTANLTHFHNQMGAGLSNLDQALDHISAQRSAIGSRLRTLDIHQNIHSADRLSLQTSLSTIQDLDYAEAISRLNLQSVSLQAAQQAFVKVQGLSLFQYL